MRLNLIPFVIITFSGCILVEADNATTTSGLAALESAAAAEHASTVGNGTQCYLGSEQLFEAMTAFFEAFLFPNDVEQSDAINSSYIAEDCKGLVDITRKFDGVELNTEYLFGMFAIANSTEYVSFNIIGFPSSFTITEFVGNCDVAHTSAIVNFSLPFLDDYIIPIQIDATTRLNSAGQVEEYAAIFVRFEWAYNITNSLYAMKLANSDVVTQEGIDMVKMKAVESICQVHEDYCAGTPYGQYYSTEQCKDYLFSYTRFGESYEGGMNTVFCRTLHQNMVKERPSVHCAHIGPSGGDMCTDADRDYDLYVGWNEDYITNMVVV